MRPNHATRKYKTLRYIINNNNSKGIVSTTVTTIIVATITK